MIDDTAGVLMCCSYDYDTNFPIDDFDWCAKRLVFTPNHSIHVNQQENRYECPSMRTNLWSLFLFLPTARSIFRHVNVNLSPVTQIESASANVNVNAEGSNHLFFVRLFLIDQRMIINYIRFTASTKVSREISIGFFVQEISSSLEEMIFSNCLIAVCSMFVKENK